MFNKNTLIVIVFFVVIASVLYIALKPTSNNKRYAYLINQRTYDEFDGTKELKARIVKVEEKQKVTLDSLSLIVNALEAGKGDKVKITNVKNAYNTLYQGYSASNRKMAEEYSDEIWKQINQYVNEFGKKEKYDFIYGANGTGSIMFADSSLDLTSAIVNYINMRYAGK